MKSVGVYLLQILLLIATHAVFVNSDFMKNLVSFVKATSSNHTAFDLKKLIDKSNENDRLGSNKEGMKYNLVDTDKRDNKTNHTIGDQSINSVNKIPMILQQQKDIHLNLNKSNFVTSQTIVEKSNHTVENKTKDKNSCSIIIQLLNITDFNLTKDSSVMSEIPIIQDKNMDNAYGEEEIVNVATPYSIVEGRRVNLVRGNSFQGQDNEQRNENKDYVKQDSSSSSSRELPDWKLEFKKLWQHKKFEALNRTRPTGDNVNMLGARPWGVSCGDPAQHDMPWGNCMTAMECEPEYRIYRGDVFCGRTTFVCCSLMLSTYDMYQGFDASFDEKSYSSGSDENRARGKSSKERRKKEIEKEKRKRKKIREKSAIKIRKNIKKIIKEIRKILNKQYRNGTRERKRRTRQLKRFIKSLKKQYKKDRKSIKDLHDKEMVSIDDQMQKKLASIKVMNEDFMRNETFREIVVNGSISKQGARMLLQKFPELDEYMEQRWKKKNKARRGRSRRTMAQTNSSEEDLQYDISIEKEFTN